MAIIQNFKRIRSDGKVIDESMKASDIFALGAPEKVVEVRWTAHDEEVSLRFPHGVLAVVVDGRHFVAINESDERGGRNLWVLNSDGSKRFQVPNVQNVGAQKMKAGAYRWFEGSRKSGSNTFGVVFECSGDKSLFQIDIDAEHGNIEGIYPMR